MTEESKKQFKDLVNTDHFGRRYNLPFNEAYDLFLNKGYGIRRSVWPSFQFVWWPKVIPVTSECFIAANDPVMGFAVSLTNRTVPMELGPLQFRLFLNKENKMESRIMGGYIFTKEDEDADDWEEFFIPKATITPKTLS